MLALYFVLKSGMSIGEMMAIFVYAGMVTAPINMLLRFTQRYHDAKEAMDRLNDILRLKTETKYEMKTDPLLSGGQRQRLSIARVLLDKPKVIIFDESTSSLDMQTEDRLLEALDEYIKDKTVITIAHRQTTIDKSERVIEL